SDHVIIYHIFSVSDTYVLASFAHKRGGAVMKILLAISSSPCSKAAVREVALRPWPASSQLRVVSVAPRPAMTPVKGFRQYAQLPSGELSTKVERVLLEIARNVIADALRELANVDCKLQVTSEVRQGGPATCILDEADRWGANLIVLGSCSSQGWRQILSPSM